MIGTYLGLVERVVAPAVGQDVLVEQNLFRAAVAGRAHVQFALGARLIPRRIGEGAVLLGHRIAFDADARLHLVHELGLEPGVGRQDRVA